MPVPPEPPSTRPTLLAQVSTLGDQTAWRRFVDVYRPFILAQCRKAGLNDADADDVTQIVLVALVRALPRFRYDPARRFRGYLTRVVLNAVLTYWRKAARCPGGTGRGAEAAADRADPIGRMAADLDDRVTADLTLLDRVLRRVRERVAEHTWRAYQEVAMHDGKPAEVAARLGLTAATVYMAKQRVGTMIREEAERLRGEQAPE